MPHIVVKMKAGRTEEMKQKLAASLTAAMTSALGVPDSAVSIAILDVAPERWNAEVYEPEIRAKMDTLYRKPGY